MNLLYTALLTANYINDKRPTKLQGACVDILRNYLPLMYLFSSSLLEEKVNAFTTLK
jgi:hypothetical protein